MPKICADVRGMPEFLQQTKERERAEEDAVGMTMATKIGGLLLLLFVGSASMVGPFVRHPHLLWMELGGTRHVKATVTRKQ